jgi:methylenetetrahydrofolate reductase (NADPH)
MTDVNLLPQTFHIDIPEELVHELSKCRSDEEAREVGIEWATLQSRDLLKNEVPGIHYYTLGRSDNIARIVKASY